MSDQDQLLRALYSLCDRPSTRPSVVQARMSLLPDWSSERIEDATTELINAESIMDVRGPMWNASLTSKGRERAKELSRQPTHQVFNVGTANNSPIQQIAAGARGVQAISYSLSRADLEAAVDVYRSHVDELGLSAPLRKKADAQVATIEAQLLDEPDDSIVRAAGQSLKTIIEGAIAGGLGTVASNPDVWHRLLSLFT